MNLNYFIMHWFTPIERFKRPFLRYKNLSENYFTKYIFALPRLMLSYLKITCLNVYLVKSSVYLKTSVVQLKANKNRTHAIYWKSNYIAHLYSPCDRHLSITRRNARDAASIKHAAYLLELLYVSNKY